MRQAHLEVVARVSVFVFVQRESGETYVTRSTPFIQSASWCREGGACASPVELRRENVFYQAHFFQVFLKCHKPVFLQELCNMSAVSGNSC